MRNLVVDMFDMVLGGIVDKHDYVTLVRIDLHGKPNLDNPLALIPWHGRAIVIFHFPFDVEDKIWVFQGHVIKEIRWRTPPSLEGCSKYTAFFTKNFTHAPLKW